MLELRTTESNTPPRPSSSESGPTKELNARICHSWPTWMSKQLRLKSSCHSPLADTKKEVSKKSTAPLLKDSSTHSWWRAETVVRSNWPLESWSKPSSSSPSKLDKILFKSLLTPSPTVVPEKTLLESVQVVSSEDKPSTFPHWEELTKQFTWSPRDQESLHSETSRPWVKC